MSAVAGFRPKARRKKGGRARGFAAAAVIGISAVLVSSCASDGIYSVALPGGADIGDNPMRIDVRFDDVLDLVPQSAVKVDGVAVGRVDKIDVAADGWTASVHTLVNSSVKLPANALAEVKQSNLLGEKFVELTAPKQDPSADQLRDGAVIPVERTRHATEVEQVLGALSLLLNGGGVAQLQPIVVELNKALSGREDKVRSLLDQADTLITGLNQQVDDIQHALDGLGTLSTRVGQQTEQIGKILDELPAGVKVLNEQRPQLIGLLQQLDRVGQAGFDVLDKSNANLIRDLQALRPTLQELGRSAPDLVTAFPLIPTYPFPDEAIKSAIGGSVNTWLSVDLQIGTTLSNLGVGKQDPVYIPPPYGPPVPVNPSNPYYNGNGPRPGWPTVSLLPLPPTVVAPADGRPGDPIGSILEQLGVKPR
ncbi:phospholipid/cholesterol/gamma-HCH transport system substrate-binding protein [Nocardia transvalensis]|uniref:Phospholipid/cholesterol/gamma-HCH transport system substrate-binding protein n=1 Tax=Nocardia transvalensis TaxID=37333 RepID=A0A7W9UIS1_9NOCA|nr:MCE family protein [Nocardia transvalensis]MBB5914492.1 phospholipid/cholesterol/gamma-HCH transport system substrate-binding protein [Nocardia transvalensis]